MFSTDITAALVLLVASGIALLFALWVLYDRRDRQLYDASRRKTTYHCLKCSHLYTSVEQRETCVCPRCGHENPRLHF